MIRVLKTLARTLTYYITTVDSLRRELEEERDTGKYWYELWSSELKRRMDALQSFERASAEVRELRKRPNIDGADLKTLTELLRILSEAIDSEAHVSVQFSRPMAVWEYELRRLATLLNQLEHASEDAARVAGVKDARCTDPK